ncbi:hypothetical protein FB45DRAFT_927147 [Roridomyces roridus]|uniref:ZZ-type domain-containing protein n=1 Tax=Roridomyces roridus TaxID=1738132 RepID=A0AAD7BIH7_9AGAR|nr:hypothetical protein FB45DRAFT_927147 [Roridomyces roridus]
MTEEEERQDTAFTVEAVYKSVSAHPIGTEDHPVGETEEKLTGKVTRVKDTYEDLNNYCTKNAKIFNRTINILGSELDIKSLESTFVEVSKVLVDGLGILGELHPFVRVVVGPLKLILAYDLNRRQNDKKVTAVKMQILDTATVLFRLRNLREPQMKGPDGEPLRDMADLMKRIAIDIQRCASACDFHPVARMASAQAGYLDKNVLAKWFRSKEYQDRFAQFMKNLQDDQRALASALSAYTAIGISSANEKLDEQGSDIKTIKTQLETLFRKLDTPRERAGQKLIATKGGAKACVESDAALEELVEISGESFESLVPSRLTKGRGAHQRLEDARSVLSKELSEDVNKAFDKHLDDFDRKLKAQEQQLNQISADIHSTSRLISADIHSTSAHVITTVIDVLSGGVQGEITNEDLKELWKQRTWKGSVDARDFVLALNEYFASQLHVSVSTEREANPEYYLSRPDSPVSSIGEDADTKEDHGDAWALAYINVAHIQPLLDVIDIDGTEFISISEANHFARLLPPKWSLLRWFAFWAAGWQLSVMWHRSRIYTLLRGMLTLVHRVKPANIQAANTYFSGPGIQCVELLLRSTRTPETGTQDPHLTKLAREFHDLEERRIKTQLEELRYKLDNIDTLRLVTGAQSSGLRRIEMHVYPLLHQILQRHLSIIQLACLHTLHEDEFPAMTTSLATIFKAVDHRTKKLAGMFKSNAKNETEGFTYFGFGMFEKLHGNVLQRDANENTITVRRSDEDGSEDVSHLGPHPDDDPAGAMEFFRKVDAGILLYGFGEEPKQLNVPKQEPVEPLPLTVVTDPIDGVWEGHIHFPNGSTPWGRMSMKLSRTGDEFSGGIDNFMGLLEVAGKVETETQRIRFTITWPKEYWNYSLVCGGPYYPLWANTLAGSWRQSTDIPQDARDSGSLGNGGPLRFVFHRTKSAEDGPSPQWQKLIAATTKIIRPIALRRVQARKQLEWLVKHLEQRKRFIQLIKREIAGSENISTSWKPLDEQEDQELYQLKNELPPWDARVYDLLARSELQKLVKHDRICDSCRKSIHGTRRFCIQCIDEQFGDCVDVCEQCHEQTPEALNPSFTHKESHLLAKTIRRLHDGDLAWMIPQAKSIARRIQERLKAAEVASSRMGGAQGGSYSLAFRPQIQPLHCCCCSKPVSHPFWVCIECSIRFTVDDPVVCMDCDAKGVTTKQDGIYHKHSLPHVLVKLQNNEPIPEPQIVELTFKGVMSRLAEMEMKMAAGQNKLDRLTSLLEEFLGKHKDSAVEPTRKEIGPAMRAITSGRSSPRVESDSDGESSD